VQLPLLLEDPEGATVRGLAREAHALLQSRTGGGDGAGRGALAPRSAWIAPALGPAWASMLDVTVTVHTMSHACVEAPLYV